MGHRPRGAGLGVLLLAVLTSGCATNPVTGDQDFVLLSEEQELALGADYHEQILDQYTVYEDEALQSAVRRIGQRLAQNSHRPGLEYHFTVLDDPAVNAFALPGGYIYITRGIMAYFNSEAELAGVVGHEIGHVTARHSVQQYSAATASGVLGTILLAGAGAGQAGAELFRTVQLAAIRGYGREHELQADRLGAQYLARSGYDPEEMLGVIEILADQEEYAIARAEAEGREPNVYHGIFSTHPENDARLQRVVRAARAYRAEQSREPGRDAYLRLVDGMTFGPATDQGVVLDREFLHRDLDAGLEAPPGWTIENRPDRLLLQSGDGSERVIVRLETLDEPSAARELLADRAGNVKLADGRDFETQAGAGRTAVAIQRTPVGERRVRHAVVIKDRQAWFFAGYSRSGDGFERLTEKFLEIARSLHALSADERARARPLQIRIVTVQPGDTWADLARQVPDRVEDPVARLRLLNGDYPSGQPVAGQRVKTLR